MIDQLSDDFVVAYANWLGVTEGEAYELLSAEPLEDVTNEEVTAAGWDEAAHPRHPEGSEEGGQFAPKVTGGALSAPQQEALKGYREGLKRASDFSRENAADTVTAMQEIWGETSPRDVDLDEREVAKMEVMNTIARKLEGDEDFLSLLPKLASGGAEFTELQHQYEGEFPQADTPEKLTTALAISNWAKTSGDSDPISLQFQIAAEQEFGVKAHPFVHEAWEQVKATGSADLLPPMPPTLLGRFQKHYVWNEQEMAGARKFLRAQYEATQEMLKSTGLKEVTLYRGMRWGFSDPPPAVLSELLHGPGGDLSDTTPRLRWTRQELAQNPLSSWSWDHETAANFSRGTSWGAVVGARIPTERVLSTPYTGFGALHEGEFVVLGNEEMAGFLEVRKHEEPSTYDGFLSMWQEDDRARA